MGSEHYCLRWNNHQSNLLGVFSQLLQDESLVDVTLACSEGAPIRAHKVVLSACSSYFQSLFLDHPEKHPIVILKDVRFAELQTLVEFMYKGEVNVQYCQLSALLKTAESLKVKGLAEMTNQNTALREPEREPERLRPHTHPSKSNTRGSPVDAPYAGPSMAVTTSADGTTISATTITTASFTVTATSATSFANTSATTTIASIPTSSGTTAGSKCTDHYSTQQHHQQHQHHHHQHHHPYHHHGSSSSSNSERCSPSPPKRLHSKTEINTPLPLDLYQGRSEPQQQQQHDELDENSITNQTKLSEKGRSSTTSPLPAVLIVSGTSQNLSSNPDNSSKISEIGGNFGVGDVSVTPKHSLDNRKVDLSSPNRPASSCDMQHRELDDDPMLLPSVDKIEDVDDVEYGDEEMELEDDGDNSCEEVGLNMKIGGSSLAAALISPHLTGAPTIEVDSARSTPLTTSEALASEQHIRRPASQGSFGGGERPKSRGAYCGLASSTSITSMPSVLSPVSSAAAALGLSESLVVTSALGPVQSVPLSLKKEIDCDDDNSNSNRLLQPRSASASGILGGELDYRTPQESETSESPHGISGGGGSNAGCSGPGNSLTASASTATSYSHDQPQTPPPYICMYCGSAFPHQSKLTRHILTHSLKTLEYRETTTHPLLHTHLLAHDLNMAPLAAYQMNAAMAATASADPQEQAAAVAAAVAMDMDFAAAIAAAGGCAAFSSLASCTGRSLDLDGNVGVGGGGGCSSSSGRSGRDGLNNNAGGGSTSGNGGCAGSSLSLLSGSGSSTSAAAAAAAAAASSSTSATSLLTSPMATASNDPNSVVLCKFCGKSFPDVTSLITHLPVHTGDRPFKCEFCGKAFKLRHHMKDHCRVHTGERPFRCHMCGKTFSRSTILKAHEKTHFPKYARKFLSPSPVDTKDELPQ